MIVRESSSHKATGSGSSASLAANVDRKKLKITNTSTGAIKVNFSGTTPSGTDYDQLVAVGETVTVENYVGECKAEANIRYVEFT